MRPELSIIVRTMGRPELAAALQSIRAQAHPGIEIVLVLADPSFDPAPFLGDDLRVVVRDGRLLRPLAANAGLDAARGEWIGFLDEDDLQAANHARLLLQVARDSRSLLVYGDLFTPADGEGATLSRPYWKRQHAEHPIPHLIGTLLSRRLIDVHKVRFDPDFPVFEDWDFFVQCGEFTDFEHVDVTVAHYNAHLGQSGCGAGPNRNDEVVAQGIERMNAKWSVRYGQVVTQSDALLTRAQDALTRKDFAQAEDFARQGLAYDPGHPLLLNRLALCHRQAGDWGGVLSAMRRAADTDRSAFNLHCEVAVLEYRYGSKERCARLIERLRRAPLDADRAARLQRAMELVGAIKA